MKEPHYSRTFVIQNKDFWSQVKQVNCWRLFPQTLQLFTMNIKAEIIYKCYYKCQAVKLGLKNLSFLHLSFWSATGKSKGAKLLVKVKECSVQLNISSQSKSFSENFHGTNVCREIGLLLSFVYIFGWVACRCCLLPPKWRHFGPASLSP